MKECLIEQQIVYSFENQCGILLEYVSTNQVVLLQIHLDKSE